MKTLFFLTLDFLPVVRCKRRSLADNKCGGTKCLESKNTSSNRPFRIAKARDNASSLITSGILSSFKFFDLFP